MLLPYSNFADCFIFQVIVCTTEKVFSLSVQQVIIWIKSEYCNIYLMLLRANVSETAVSRFSYSLRLTRQDTVIYWLSLRIFSRGG